MTEDSNQSHVGILIGVAVGATFVIGIVLSAVCDLYNARRARKSRNKQEVQRAAVSSPAASPDVKDIEEEAAKTGLTVKELVHDDSTSERLHEASSAADTGTTGEAEGSELQHTQDDNGGGALLQSHVEKGTALQTEETLKALRQHVSIPNSTSPNLDICSSPKRTRLPPLNHVPSQSTHDLQGPGKLKEAQLNLGLGSGAHPLGAVSPQTTAPDAVEGSQSDIAAASKSQKSPKSLSLFNDNYWSSE